MGTAAPFGLPSRDGAMVLPKQARRWTRFLRLALARWSGPTEVAVDLFTGDRMYVRVPELVGNALYLDGIIEPATSRVLLEWLRPGAVFFDVGAHYGYYSVLAGRAVGPGGAVVAFEPGRDTQDILRRNVHAMANVHVENIAVGDTDGIVTFRDYGVGHSALNTVLEDARVPRGERRRLRAHSYDVTSTRLDTYVASTGWSRTSSNSMPKVRSSPSCVG